ncbi:F-box SKIP14-like [Olea europaea subsp. europaea]|nr:F-box SKIP14-like [Olea europaea subsp. europaea]
MALNYSQRPIIPAHISEDNLVSPMRILNGYLAEDVPDKNGEGYSKACCTCQGEAEEWNFNCGGDRVDLCSSTESTAKDIVDLLPSDPFGMDIETTFTAITGWLEDLEFDYQGYMRNNNNEDYGLFAGWNLIWNNAFSNNAQFDEKLNVGTQYFPSNLQVYEKPDESIHTFTDSIQFDEKLNAGNQAHVYREEREMGGALSQYELEFLLAHNMRDIEGHSNEGASSSSELQFGGEVEGAVANLCRDGREMGGALAQYELGFLLAHNMRDIVGLSSEGARSSSELQFGGVVDCAVNCVKDEGTPHEALTFAFSYLGVKDLLSVQRVCKSFCSTVKGDPLLWMSIHIDRPLNERVTDDVLVQLVSRAQGNLQCLSLVECPRITDDGLRRILAANPRLTKLSVPGCTRLTIEGILNNLKAYNSNIAVPGIKSLRIGGIYGVTYEHFEELRLLLGYDSHKLENNHRPHFYSRGSFYLPCDDDRAIDIETCPRCEKLRLVYDCPAAGCQVKDQATKACRACTLCIVRCAQCGRCINDMEYEETFCLELLCSDCFKQLNKYQDGLDEKVDTPKDGALHEPNFCLHG